METYELQRDGCNAAQSIRWQMTSFDRERTPYAVEEAEVGDSSRGNEVGPQLSPPNNWLLQRDAP